MKQLALKLIHLYRNYFSSSTHWLVRMVGLSEVGCRFTPRCSEYTYQAVEKYGLVRGAWRGLKRVVRCHPWSQGGFDPLG